MKNVAGNYLYAIIGFCGKGKAPVPAAPNLRDLPITRLRLRLSPRMKSFVNAFPWMSFLAFPVPYLCAESAKLEPLAEPVSLDVIPAPLPIVCPFP